MSAIDGSEWVAFSEMATCDAPGRIQKLSVALHMRPAGMSSQIGMQSDGGDCDGGDTPSRRGGTPAV